MSRYRSCQQGFGLVEVLLAVLIGSIGMLGLAASQLVAARALENARHYSQATLLAVDIQTRLRANPNTRAIYLVDDLGAGGRSYSLVRDCRRVACSPAELAHFDLYQWFRQIVGPEEDAQLPATWVDAPPGMRACLDGSGTQVSVLLAWQGRGPALSEPGASNCPLPHAGNDRQQYAVHLSSWGAER